MISIFARETDYATVREFFQLFKTPWQFHEEGEEADVVLSANGELPANSGARLILIYSSKVVERFDQEESIAHGKVDTNRLLKCDSVSLPIYGDCRTFPGSDKGGWVDSNSGEAASVERSSGQQTIVRLGFDLFAEVAHLLVVGQPPAHAAIPTLDLHIAILRSLMLRHGLEVVEIPPVPEGYRGIACLTHDVDHPGILFHKWDHSVLGFLLRATVGSMIDFWRGRKSGAQLMANWKAAVSLPFVYFGKAKDPWRQFATYREMEGTLPSTWFFLPAKGNPGQDMNGGSDRRRAAAYSLEDVADEIARLRADGCEIGVHGIDAWRESEKGRTELAAVAAQTKTTSLGTRMHWLYYDAQSPRRLEEAGYTYDATLGYNETIGYRRGTSQVFQPFGTRDLLELPMHVMDTALFFPGYLHLTVEQATARISDLIEQTSTQGGVLTINWHDRSLGPERLWGAAYDTLLSKLRTGTMWVATASDAVAWFRKRRQASLAVSRNTEGNLRIKVNATGGEALPPLLVRVYHAHGRAESLPAFTDYPLADSEEFLIAA